MRFVCVSPGSSRASFLLRLSFPPPRWLKNRVLFRFTVGKCFSGQTRIFLLDPAPIRNPADKGSAVQHTGTVIEMEQFLVIEISQFSKSVTIHRKAGVSGFAFTANVRTIEPCREINIPFPDPLCCLRGAASSVAVRSIPFPQTPPILQSILSGLQRR